MKKLDTLFGFVVSILIVFSCVVNADIYLTVNGSNPSDNAGYLNADKPVAIGLAGSAELTDNKYDLTISVTGGQFQDSSKKSKPTDTVDILTDDPNSVDEYILIPSDKTEVAEIELITNKDMIIDGLDASAGTTIYKVVFFYLTETDQIAVLAVGYNALSYVPPVKEAAVDKTSSSLLLDSPIAAMAMTTSYIQSDSMWFIDPNICPDMNSDDIVDVSELLVLADNWLETGSSLDGDLNEDGIVNLKDFLFISAFWMTDPGCEFPRDEKPYHVTFTPDNGFEVSSLDANSLEISSLHGQGNWSVDVGNAAIYEIPAGYLSEDNFGFYPVVCDANSIISKGFDGEGDDSILRAKFHPSDGTILNVYDGNSIAASLYFEDNETVSLLTGSGWQTYDISGIDGIHGINQWKLRLEFDYDEALFSAYLFDEAIGDANGISMPDLASTITDFELISGRGYTFLTSLQINDYNSGGTSIGDYQVLTPCGCTDDELAGLERSHLTYRDPYTEYARQYLRPTDADPLNLGIWVEVGTIHRAEMGHLDGSIDFSRIPNGIYNVGYEIVNDEGYIDNSFVLTKELDYGGYVYEDDAVFTVVGKQKVNSYQETKPLFDFDIPGYAPLNLYLIYDGSRRNYIYPFEGGFYLNHWMDLVEYTTFEVAQTDSGPFKVPDRDDDWLGMGPIMVKNPDGSYSRYRPLSGQTNNSKIKYVPDPDDGSGNYIIRTSYGDWPTIDHLTYELYIRADGSKRTYETDVNISGGMSSGAVGWSSRAVISEWEDIHGNVIEYTWDNQNNFLEWISNGVIDIEIRYDEYDNCDYMIAYSGDEMIQAFGFFLSKDYDKQCLSFEVVEFGYGIVTAEGVIDSSYDVDRWYRTLGPEDPNIAMDPNDYDIDIGWESYRATCYYMKPASEVYFRYNITAGSFLTSVAEADPYGEYLVKEIAYDDYGRVEIIRNWISEYNCMDTYSFYDLEFDGPEGDTLSQMTTYEYDDYKAVKTVVGDKGEILEKDIRPYDGSASTVSLMEYNDSLNPRKPTWMAEYFNGGTEPNRITTANYTSMGDPEEIRVYDQNNDYTLTQYTYHPVYNFATSETKYTGLNGTGQINQTLYKFGDKDGNLDPYGNFLCQKWELIDDATNDWAVTYYTYYEDGKTKSESDPVGVTKYNTYMFGNTSYALETSIAADPNDPNFVSTRELYDLFGNKWVEATDKSVTINDYDWFSRNWQRRIIETGEGIEMPLSDFGVFYFADTEPDAYWRYGKGIFGDGNTFERLPSGGQIHRDYNYIGGETWFFLGDPNLIPEANYDDPNWVFSPDDYFSNTYTYYRSDGKPSQKLYYDNILNEYWLQLSSYDDMGRETLKTTTDFLGRAMDDPNFIPGAANPDSFVIRDIVRKTHKEYDSLNKPIVDDLYGSVGVEKIKDCYYDSFGNLTGYTLDPDGADITTELSPNAVGKVEAVKKPDGSVVYHYFYNNNKKKAVSFAVSAETSREQASIQKYYTYYPDGQVKTETVFDKNGPTYQNIDGYSGAFLSKSAYTYDYKKRVTSSIQYLDAVNTIQTTYEYPEAGFDIDNVIYDLRITDPNDNVTYVKFNHNNKVTHIIYPDGRKRERGFNGEGTLDYQIVYDGTTADAMQYEYSEYAQLDGITYPDGDVVFELSGFGSRIGVTDNRSNDIGGSQTIVYDVDPLGRRVGKLDQNGIRTSTPLRADGQSISISAWLPGTDQEDPFAAFYQMNYSYDNAGQPTDMNRNLFTPLVRQDYSVSENRKTLEYIESGGSFFVDYYTTSDGHPLSINSTDNTFEVNVACTDGLGRQVLTNESYVDAYAQIQSHSRSYDYNKLGYLEYSSTSGVNSQIIAETYHLDYSGNIVHHNTDIGGQSSDLLLNWDGYDLTILSGYINTTMPADENGNWLTLPTESQSQIDWTTDGRLSHCVNGYDEMWAVYDPEGNITWKDSTLTGEHNYVTVQINKLSCIIADLDSNLNVQKLCYVDSKGKTLATEDQSGGVDFLIYDFRNVRLVIDGNSGNVVGNYLYDPYGQTYICEETVFNEYRYSGLPYDQVSGLYHMRARYYDSTVGQFISWDPIKSWFNPAEHLSRNPYLYCGADPISKVDKNGEMFTGLVGTVVAMVSGFVADSAYHQNHMTLFYAGLGGFAIGTGLFIYDMAVDNPQNNPPGDVEKIEEFYDFEDKDAMDIVDEAIKRQEEQRKKNK